ncbi:MAG: DUF6516 family protein [Syntrophales bacterium]|nr:DUF6516 family protein [Syntrophales bacterium]MDD5641988.1 DUF6516 family protein [Syntrophales bacterium]
MTSLPSLLGKVVAILQSHPVCRKITSIDTKEFSPDQFYFKIRAAVLETTKLQIRIYYNRGHIDYAYQWFADIPICRWDNKEEFSSLPTYPHHYHDHQGFVKLSPLIGNPILDIQIVLQEISQLLELGRN